MKPITAEWVEKAEEDFLTANREANAAPRPNNNASVYHSQQCIEKYLKARLVEAGLPFPRTHDLARLLNLLLPVEPGWQAYQAPLSGLSALSINVRYPGLHATPTDASQALQTAADVRRVVRASLGFAA